MNSGLSGFINPDSGLNDKIAYKFFFYASKFLKVPWSQRRERAREIYFWDPLARIEVDFVDFFVCSLTSSPVCSLSCVFGEGFLAIVPHNLCVSEKALEHRAGRAEEVKSENEWRRKGGTGTKSVVETAGRVQNGKSVW